MPSAVQLVVKDPTCERDELDPTLYPNGCAEPEALFGWAAALPITIPAPGSSTTTPVCNPNRYLRGMCIRIVGDEGEAFFKIESVIHNPDGTGMLAIQAVGGLNPTPASSLSSSKGMAIFPADCPVSDTEICFDDVETAQTEDSVTLAIWTVVKNAADCVISTCLKKFCPTDNNGKTINGLLYQSDCELKIAPCERAECLDTILGYSGDDPCKDDKAPKTLRGTADVRRYMVWDGEKWCPGGCKEWKSVAKPGTTTHTGTAPDEPGQFLIVKAENEGDSLGVLLTITVNGMVLVQEYVESNNLINPAVSTSAPIPLPCGATYTIETTSGTITDVCLFSTH